ncbi:hypothetical protein D5Z92_14640 [Listeria monocytogenes]|nr:hypothetical protein [Listeria monocytogenes]
MKKALFSRLFVALAIVGGINLWLGISNELNVQAESLDQPTPLNQVFPDEALAEVVKASLNKSDMTDSVTQAELNTVKFIDGQEKSIASIEGLQYLSNLETLRMKDNKISDISLLSHLSNLRVINLSNNQITDITSLAHLKKYLV